MYFVEIKLDDESDITTHIFDDKESLLEYLKYIYSEFGDDVTVVAWKQINVKPDFIVLKTLKSVEIYD